jgi:ubiquinone/menaquinone biosynthesis C-methylase UbiE
MKDPQRNPSKRYHDRVASRYDRMYEDIYWEFHDELTWRAIKPFIPRDLSAKCLDLGCGTGKWGLKLLKSGYATTFLDHSPAMIDETRAKLAEMGAKGARGTPMVGDIVNMPQLPDNAFSLTLAMGDPLSICDDSRSAAREMFRVGAPKGVVIATADSKPAALEHFVQRGRLDELEEFVRTSRTRWLTDEEKEQFDLRMFTPATLRDLFEEAGFSVISVVGKTILPMRKHRRLLENPENMERLLKLERELEKDESLAGSASHLQITAIKS